MRVTPACLFLSVLLAFGPLRAAVAEDPEPEPTDAEPVLTETVTVTATRLPASPPAEHVPATVTVLDREQIERAGVRTLQDLLALEPGVVVYDQVGNDIEKTFDLRGFAQGTGTRVFLDGAPLNDTRNNALALDMIPLEAIERVEVSHGSAAAFAGAGAEAGAIHVVTRRGTGLGGAVSASSGSYDTSNLGGEVYGGSERFDFFVSASGLDTDGFRDNAGGDVRRLAGSGGAEWSRGRRLSLSVVDTRSELGNPGALNAAELEADPGGAPFNRLDFSNQDFTQAALNFSGPLGGAWSISANAFVRDAASELLSTGRSAALFGGFFLDTEASTAGSTVQAAHTRQWGTASNRLLAGLEWLDGDTDALGYFTPPEDPASVDVSSPASSNTAERRTQALYVQDVWRPLADWTFMLGARQDADRVEYRDALVPDVSDARRFSELSLQAGAHWQLVERHGVRAAYGEGFLPPTAEELFSFPLFFSNSDLEPEDSRSYEVGYSGAWGEDLRADLALYQIDTADEIVFVPDPPPAFTGANENVGSARRRGIEARLQGRPHPRVAWFANLSFVDAEFRDGPQSGRDVPLVPEGRVGAGVDCDLPARLHLRLDALAVGEQVVDNDPGPGLAEPLEAYEVVNARLGWATPGSGLRLWAEARNLLDEDYATRAIWAGETFFTPAPGRRWAVGAGWSF